MTSDNHQIDPVVHKFIEHASALTQSFGFGRVIGQIYAYLYFSPEPKNLADLQGVLAISKGSASTGVRQLEQWGAVKKIWVRGDRKDYYIADDWLGHILKNAIMDTVGKKLDGYGALLDDVEGQLASAGGNGNGKFLRERVRQLKNFQRKTRKIWNAPLVKMMLR